MTYTQTDTVIARASAGVKIVDTQITVISGGFSGAVVNINPLSRVLSFYPGLPTVPVAVSQSGSQIAVAFAAAVATSGGNQLVISTPATIVSGSTMKILSFGV